MFFTLKNSLIVLFIRMSDIKSTNLTLNQKFYQDFDARIKAFSASEIVIVMHIELTLVCFQNISLSFVKILHC